MTAETVTRKKSDNIYSCNKTIDIWNDTWNKFDTKYAPANPKAKATAQNI